MKTFILYHKNCFDGFGAAYAAWKHFGDKATYIPVTYGDKIPEGISKGDEVYIVDFCFPAEDLIELQEKAKVLVLDHHDSAEKHLKNSKCNCVFDQKRSGAKITWDYFFPNQKNDLIEYISDKDLWNFHLPNSEAINLAIESQPKKFEVWDSLTIENLLIEGVPVLKRLQEDIKMIVKKAYVMDFKGYKIHVVNTCHLNSEVGNEILKMFPDDPFTASYYDFERDGILHRKWSFRSRKNGFNLVKFCEPFGGGGHPGSTGWVEMIGKTMERYSKLK